jgi:hypothetical protein
VQNLVPKIIATGLLLTLTVVAYGGCFKGWFLPKPLASPVSLRDGSTKGSHGRGLYFLGGFGRSHYGGGYAGGK